MNTGNRLIWHPRKKKKVFPSYLPGNSKENIFIFRNALRLRLQLLLAVVGKRKENYIFTSFIGNLLVFWFYFAFTLLSVVFLLCMEHCPNPSGFRNSSNLLSKPFPKPGWQHILNKCPLERCAIAMPDISFRLKCTSFVWYQIGTNYAGRVKNSDCSVTTIMCLSGFLL